MKFITPILMLFGLTVYAAEGDSITAYVNVAQVKRNQPFEVGIKYTGTHKYNVDFEAADGAQLISGPVTSSTFSSVNGVSTSSGGIKYYYKCDKEGQYVFTFSIKNVDSLTAPYTISVNVSNEQWTAADEQVQRKEEVAQDPFKDDFFKDFWQPKTAPSSPQQQQIKPIGRKDIAKLVSFQPQFAEYDAAVGKATMVRYIVRFNKVSNSYNNVAQMYLAKLPAAKYVHVEMQGSGDMSAGSKNEDEQAQQITIVAHCTKPGKYILSPLVIKYNGKRYKAAKVTLNTIYKGGGIEI